ncbi:molybdopterin molybdotransferase MoeA [Marinactinospora thermotolerans]|uniref:molybdopterin molybdotransferase MoeA n=1 Tax=Marinactinospora thermotolerans TaxID=531310 RepID=UPI003D8BD2A3
MDTTPPAPVSTRPSPRRRAPQTWPRARAAARELAAARPRGAVTEVALGEALGSTLAVDLVARVAVPSLDTAAMDGYAVAGSGPWRVLGRLLAGAEPRDAALSCGQAVEIATGAPVPAGTLAVLAHEEAERNAHTVSGRVRPGRHIRRRGETTPLGSVAAPAGSPVTPALLALAAGLGHDTLRVRRPTVHALVTGDEVRLHGTPAPGQVRDAIGPMLPGTVSWAGGVLTAITHVGDDPAELTAALERAVGEADIVAVCGASSAGPADHLRAVLGGFGAGFVVDGVACRPGHPQLLAALPEGPLVVGLPGNPGAALVAALTLLVPVIAGLAGRPDPAPTGRRVRLAGDVRPHPVDTRLIGVRLCGEGALAVEHVGPADLRGVAVADAIAVVPPQGSGDLAELLRLPR